MQVDSTTYGNTYSSAVEVFNMAFNPPENVFCYIREGTGSWLHEATTWMGDRISRPRTFSTGRLILAGLLL